MRVYDVGIDLAVALAIASSYFEIPLPEDMAAFGEVGLLGEVRPISFVDERIKEIQRAGFKKILLPKKYGMKNMIGVSNLKEAIKFTLNGIVE
jgi:DNA repair protein RadA/Sms